MSCFACSGKTIANQGKGGVGYVMYTEVFALDSKTNHFNYAVNRVRKDSRCTELLGDSKNISAYGEGGGHGNWRMARPIA